MFWVAFDETRKITPTNFKTWFPGLVFCFMLCFQGSNSYFYPYYEGHEIYRTRREIARPQSWQDDLYYRQAVLRRKIREVTEAHNAALLTNEDPQCSAKSSVAEQALEGAIHKTRRFDMIPITDDRMNMVDLKRGFVMGLHSLTPHHPIDVSCGGKEVVLRTSLSIAHVRLFYDWSAPSYKYVGTAWAFADDLQLDMTALIRDSTVSFPAVHVIEMKLQSMKNFRSGNEGPDIFALFGELNRINLLKSIMTKSLENLLKEVVWKNLQLIISQTWHNTNSKEPLVDERRPHLMYRSNRNASAPEIESVVDGEAKSETKKTTIPAKKGNEKPQKSKSKPRNKPKHKKIKAYFSHNLVNRPIKPKRVNVMHGAGLTMRTIGSGANANADGGKDGVGLTQSQSHGDKEKSSSGAQGVAANPSGNSAVSQAEGMANIHGNIQSMAQNIANSPGKGVTISQTRSQADKEGHTHSVTHSQSIPTGPPDGDSDGIPSVQLLDESSPGESSMSGAPPYLPAHCCMIQNPAYEGSLSEYKHRHLKKSHRLPKLFYRSEEEPEYERRSPYVRYRMRDFLGEPRYRTMDHDPYVDEYFHPDYYRRARLNHRYY